MQSSILNNCTVCFSVGTVRCASAFSQIIPNYENIR